MINVTQMWIVPMPLLYYAKIASQDGSKEKTNGMETKTHPIHV